jgi:Helicase HerA, central domain
MGGEATDLSKFCGVKIRILPDFLMDHTLLQPDFAQRLPEHCQRWIQFVHRLWAWRDRATFCLRFDGRPREGAVGIYLLARPRDLADRQQLQRDIEFALAAYGIVNDIDNPRLCLPLLTDGEIMQFAGTAEEQAALAAEMDHEFSKVLAPKLDDRSVYIAVSQDVMSDLWIDGGALENLVRDRRLGFGDVGVSKVSAWITQLWDGPTGSFLLPFKALMASDAPVQLSIHLEPCTPQGPERLWLDQIALYAKKSAQSETSFKDPAAEIASQRSASVARRLLEDAFSVAVVIVAADGDSGAAESLANTLRALCVQKIERETVREEDWRAGARISIASESQAAEARTSYLALEFPQWCDVPDMPSSLRRLPYLTDARGAATVFRLPVSVRGGVPGVEVEQPAPDFNPGPRSDQKEMRRSPRVFRQPRPKASIVIGKFESAGYARVDVDDFTKHTLVTGFTGSGKTMTVMHLLHQLWADHRKPFLVIESAKTEYRGLKTVPAFRAATTVPGLLIYTLGNESVAPFRLNPFELIEGVRVEAHVNRLKTCFEAAMPPFAPLGSIIEQSLIEVYRGAGWMMTDQGVARNYIEDESLCPGRRYPTMIEFAEKLEAIGESRGYVGENRATLLAAIRGRIFPLTRAMHGSKGMMLDTPLTWPSPALLFVTPTVLELNDLNLQDKALVSMFLLTMLREYREQEHMSAGGGLRHITVIEEAHNVLENVSPVGVQDGAESDVRHKAVQSFCAMLAEIRALGEGLIISDQSPEKLAPDALRNTNIQIAHQLRDARDRQAIAAAMIMSDEQREYLGKLKPGNAGIFYTGLQRASYVKVPQFDKAAEEFGGGGVDYIATLSDAVVKVHMREMTKGISELDRPFSGCRRCGHRVTCDFKWNSRHLRSQDGIKESCEKVFRASTAPEVRIRVVAAMLDSARMQHDPGSGKDAMWCYLLHLRHAFLRNDRWQVIDDDELHRFFVHDVLPQIRENAIDRHS